MKNSLFTLLLSLLTFAASAQTHYIGLQSRIVQTNMPLYGYESISFLGLNGLTYDFQARMRHNILLSYQAGTYSEEDAMFSSYESVHETWSVQYGVFKPYQNKRLQWTYGVALAYSYTENDIESAGCFEYFNDILHQHKIHLIPTGGLSFLSRSGFRFDIDLLANVSKSVNVNPWYNRHSSPLFLGSKFSIKKGFGF